MATALNSCRGTLFANFIQRIHINEETQVSDGQKVAKYNEQSSGTPREFPPRSYALANVHESQALSLSQVKTLHRIKNSLLGDSIKQ